MIQVAAAIVIIVYVVIGKFIYNNYQDAKRKEQEQNERDEQEATQRRKADEVFREAPTGFLNNSYEGFEDTPMMA